MTKKTVLPSPETKPKYAAAGLACPVIVVFRSAKERPFAERKATFQTEIQLGEFNVNESLSVVLPVFNAQKSLAQEVGELLDVLGELTEQFELVLVDDGSTDQTVEIADELAQQYPQIRVTRHPRRWGSSAAVQTGLAAATGDYVFVQDELTPLSATDIRRLWELRTDESLVAARTGLGAGVVSSDLLRRLGQWGVALQKNSAQHDTNCGIQMIRRHAIENLRKSHRESDSAWVTTS